MQPLCTTEPELHMFHGDWETGLPALHLTYLHMHLNMSDAYEHSGAHFLLAVYAT